MGTLKVNNIQSTTDGSVTFPQGSVNSSNSTINGNLSVSGTTTTNNIRFQDGSLSTPSVSFTNDTNTGLYRISEDKIGISIGGVKTGEIGSGYGGFTGNVLQVQSTAKTNPFTIGATSTFADITGLSVTITPKYITSKILIICHLGCISTNGFGGASVYRFMRDSTPVGIADVAGSRLRASMRVSSAYNGDHGLSTSMSFLDSPSSISALIYKVQMVSEYTTYINSTVGDTDGAANYQARQISTITVMELQQ